MKKLINDPHGVVRELLEGIVALTMDIGLLDDENVVVRTDLPTAAQRPVAVISGGGSGHEPAHAGYVGKGMLAAAIAGDVFTSPSSDAVLAAIVATAGPEGALLIVKNYTGDRLNFGLAAEMARQQGIPVEIVVVADDVALKDLVPPERRRGIAGTVLVHKLAGAAADQGKSLAEVARIARAAARDVGSVGVGLGPAIVPASGKAGFELADDEIEIGLGIHGEKGVERTAMQIADHLVDRLLRTILDDRKWPAAVRMGVLINNLGGTSAMELAIVARRVIAYLREHGAIVERAWSGSYLSAMEMPGVSISLMPLDAERDALFDHPAAPVAWPTNGRVPQALVVLPGASKLAEPAPTLDAEPMEVDSLRRVLLAAADALDAAEPELTDLDSKVGDGDLGASMQRGAAAARSVAAKKWASSPALLVGLALALRRAIAGSSGPFYAVGLMRAARILEHTGTTPDGIVKAFSGAVASVSELGGARPGDRTMLDALAPALAALESAIADGEPLAAGAALAATAATTGAAHTAELMPTLGRSSYLGKRALGVPDGGARAVAIWLEAIAASLRNA